MLLAITSRGGEGSVCYCACNSTYRGEYCGAGEGVLWCCAMCCHQRTVVGEGVCYGGHDSVGDRVCYAISESVLREAL